MDWFFSMLPDSIREPVRENFHLAWMLIPGIPLTYAFGRIVGGGWMYVYIGVVLALIECWSLGIHQRVHHEKRYFGKSIVFGILTGAILMGIVLFACHLW